MNLQQIQCNFLEQLYATQAPNSTGMAGVYWSALRTNLQRVLQSIYPVCFRLVGEQCFTVMVYRYIQAIPPTTPVLEDYGASFVDFVREQEPILPYLADVVHLEWAYHQAYCGSDYTPAAPELDADPESLLFYLPEHATLLASEYPINLIWQANQTEGPDTVIDLAQGGDYLLIWRKGWHVLIEPLPQAAWDLLQIFDKQLNLKEICKQAIAHVSPIDVSVWLPRFVERGWLSLKE